MTSLPLNIRWLAIEMAYPKSSALDGILGGVFFAFFTVLRILPIPFLLWHIANTEFELHYNRFETVVAMSGLIPIALNSHWYMGMVRTLTSRLAGLHKARTSWASRRTAWPMASANSNGARQIMQPARSDRMLHIRLYIGPL